MDPLRAEWTAEERPIRPPRWSRHDGPLRPRLRAGNRTGEPHRKPLPTLPLARPSPLPVPLPELPNCPTRTPVAGTHPLSPLPSPRSPPLPLPLPGVCLSVPYRPCSPLPSSAFLSARPRPSSPTATSRPLAVRRRVPSARALSGPASLAPPSPHDRPPPPPLLGSSPGARQRRGRKARPRLPRARAGLESPGQLRRLHHFPSPPSRSSIRPLIRHHGSEG